MFETTKFMFVIYRETAPNSKEYYYDKICLWNMPLQIIETHVKEMWLKTKKVIEIGNILTGKIRGKGRENNFPKASENLVCHVRPHGTNAEKTTNSLPVPDVVTGAT